MELSRVLELDQRIRAVLLIDKMGEIKAREIREGINLLLSPEELQEFTFGVAIRSAISQKWDNKLGKVRDRIIRRDKIAFFVFYVQGDTLVVAAAADTPLAIADEIASVITQN